MIEPRALPSAAWTTTLVLAPVLLTGSAGSPASARGATTLALVATGAALTAALLHAASGTRLGGEPHRVLRTTRHSPTEGATA